MKLLLSFLFTLLLISSVLAQEALIVEFKEGRLSVIAEKSPLSQILQEISVKAGVEIQGLEGAQEKISLRFFDLPLREGFQRLLANKNYILIERNKPKLILVTGAILPSEVTSNELATELRNESAFVVVISSEEGETLRREPASEVEILDGLGGEEVE